MITIMSDLKFLHYNILNNLTAWKTLPEFLSKLQQISCTTRKIGVLAQKVSLSFAVSGMLVSSCHWGGSGPSHRSKSFQVSLNLGRDCLIEPMSDFCGSRLCFKLNLTWLHTEGLLQESVVSAEWFRYLRSILDSAKWNHLKRNQNSKTSQPMGLY